MAVIVTKKPLGWTPLQVLDGIRANDQRYSQSKMVYAGRLDPMAEGLMVVLTDDDRFRLDEFLQKDKSYTATIAFGFKSDSLDALGIVERVVKPVVDLDHELELALEPDLELSRELALDLGRQHSRELVPELELERDHELAPDLALVQREISALVGTHELELPAYSAYKVLGKPLHWWAKHGRLGEIEIPKKHMVVHGALVTNSESRSAQQVLADIRHTIALVDGDFRQAEAVASWERALEGVDLVLTVHVEFNVSSGTYIRTLVNTLGDSLGCGALLLHLDRTRVGEFSEAGEY